MIEQVRGKSVAEGVRRKVLLDPRLLRVPLDDVPESLAGHAVTAAGREEVSTSSVKKSAKKSAARKKK